MNNKSIGNFGEERAVEYLKDKNYKILDRNYRALGKEIDIVTMDGNILVFIEVKTRNSKKFGNAAEAVDYFKIQNIVTASINYAISKNLTHYQIRYDIIEYYLKEDYINHIENAFYAL
ncbi:MAG: YraN family protein [Peptoniphilus sp.]|nr:YraN family protein [Peptoniphilus sp.]